MEYHNGLFFTTKDSDNDEKVDDNCALANNAIYTNGGWWFKNCWRVAPNIYGRSNSVYLNNQKHTFTHVEMKIRPLQCNI